MRIAHTSDWHMGKRLGFVDRGDDIKRCIRQIAGICGDQQVDVLLICGDLFDGNTRPEVVREWMEFLNGTFAPFLLRGGTILALTGNHDNEHLAQILRQAMQLASPAPTQPGGLLGAGRLYLFAGPTFFRLADRDGKQVQFIAMPSPTVARYLDGEAQRFNTVEERNRALKVAFKKRLDMFTAEAAYDTTLQTVLAAHIPTSGAAIGGTRTLNEAEAVVLQDSELPTAYAYIALGDIHRPQMLMNLPHVRYCGSIDRMDIGEADEEKGVLLLDMDINGLAGAPRWVRLDATPIYRVNIDDPATQIPKLAEQHPNRERALVHLTIQYRPGEVNLPSLMAELNRLFPRCYGREFAEQNGHSPLPQAASKPQTMREKIREYISARLAEHPEREAVLSLVEQLLTESNQESGT